LRRDVNWYKNPEKIIQYLDAYQKAVWKIKTQNGKILIIGESGHQTQRALHFQGITLPCQNKYLDLKNHCGLHCLPESENFFLFFLKNIYCSTSKIIPGQEADRKVAKTKQRAGRT
jgi:hypothetical protein